MRRECDTKLPLRQTAEIGSEKFELNKTFHFRLKFLTAAFFRSHLVPIKR